MKLINTKDYLLLIDEEAEINNGDYWIYINPNTTFDEIVEKTSLDEKNWFSKLHDRFAYKKVIAYFPLKIGAEELDLPLLPSPYKHIKYSIEDIYKVMEESFNNIVKNDYLDYGLIIDSVSSSKMPTVFLPEETFQEPSEYVIIDNVIQGVYL